MFGNPPEAAQPKADTPQQEPPAQEPAEQPAAAAASTGPVRCQTTKAGAIRGPVTGRFYGQFGGGSFLFVDSVDLDGLLSERLIQVV